MVVDLMAAGKDIDIVIPTRMRPLSARPRWQGTVELVSEYALDEEVGLYAREAVDLLAPLTEIQKIVCSGLNYIRNSRTRRPGTHVERNPPSDPWVMGG